MSLRDEIKLPNVAAVECPHDSDARHHGRTVEFDDQEQGFDRGLPFLEILLSLRTPLSLSETQIRLAGEVELGDALG